MTSQTPREYPRKRAYRILAHTGVYSALFFAVGMIWSFWASNKLLGVALAAGLFTLAAFIMRDIRRDTRLVLTDDEFQIKAKTEIVDSAKLSAIIGRYDTVDEGTVTTHLATNQGCVSFVAKLFATDAYFAAWLASIRDMNAAQTPSGGKKA